MVRGLPDHGNHQSDSGFRAELTLFKVSYPGNNSCSILLGSRTIQILPRPRTFWALIKTCYSEDQHGYMRRIRSPINLVTGAGKALGRVGRGPVYSCNVALQLSVLWGMSWKLDAGAQKRGQKY